MARNPAYLKPVTRYVSPHFPDRIFAEDIDTDAPNYKALLPGTSHPDASRFAGFKLGHQEPLETGKTVRRYWINDRLNQNAYNAIIEYPYGGNPSYPRITRTYVTLRSAYTPLGTNAFDPVFTNAQLRTERRLRSDERVIDNLYVIVQRVFERFPSIEWEGQRTGTWGVETTSTQDIEDGDPVDEGYGVASSQVVPQKDGSSVKQTINYPEEPATLRDLRTDEVNRILINITKDLVSPDDALPTLGPHETVERQNFDKWHSIQIVSSLDTASLPAPEVFPTTSSFRFPNLLQSIGITWSKDANFGTQVNVPQDWSAGEAKSYTVQASAGVSISGNVYVNTVEYKPGSLQARLTRTFHTSMPSAPGTALTVPGAYGTVLLRFGNKSSSRGVSYTGGGFQGSIGRRVARINFGPVIWTGVSLTNATDSITQTATASTGSLPWGGSYPVAEVEVTQDGVGELFLPTANIPSSGWTLVQYNVSKFRFGIYVEEKVEIFL